MMKFIVKKIYFILLIFLPAISTTNASNLIFEKINSNHGLSSDEVIYIYQDRDGFLWFCTENGLNVYDGYNIKTYWRKYNQEEQFTITGFTRACEDDRGRLWFGSRNSGINILDKNTGLVKAIDLSHVLSNRIHDLLIDSQGRIWIATSNGIAIYYPDKEDFKYIKKGDPKNSIRNNYTTCLYEDNNGLIWIGTWGKWIHIYHDEDSTFYDYELSIKPKNRDENLIWSFYEDDKNNMFIGTWENGLFITKYENKQLTILKHFLHDENNINSLSHNIIHFINRDKFGNFWLGTPYGLNILKDPYSDNYVFENYFLEENSSNSISNNSIIHILKDRSDIMWLSTIGGGINKFDPYGIQFEHYTIQKEKSNISGQSITSFYLDKNQNLYVGLRSNGFGMYDIEKKEYIPYKKTKKFGNLQLEDENVNLNTVECLMEDSKGNLWLGTRHNGIILYNLNTNKYRLYNRQNSKFNGKRIKCFLEDSSGCIWVGTYHGVSKFSPDSINYKISRYSYNKNKPNSLSSNYIRTLAIDNENKLWVGTRFGLNRSKNSVYSHEKLEFERFRADVNAEYSISSDYILSVYNDSKNRIWVGTSSGGLNLYESEKNIFYSFDDISEFIGNVVYDIIEDSKGGLWQSTDKGLVNFVFNSLSDYEYMVYTIEEGIQGNNFIKGACYKDQNGDIYFGGHFGFNKFNPVEIKKNDYLPPVAISEIKILDKPLKFNVGKDKLVLTHKDYYFSIEYTALSFSHPNKNKFAFKLDNFDTDWRYADASNRIANYSNLDPGEYTFMVKAANSSGVWNDKPLTIPVIVKPAPYKTIWAYIGYVIIVSLVVLLIFKTVIDRIKMKQALELEHVERVKVEKINQFKLRFFTNISHELLTPLSILICVIEERLKIGIRPEGMVVLKRNIDKLRSLIKQLLEFRKVETGNLKLLVKKGNISKFIDELAGNFNPLAISKNIEFNININDNITGWFDTDKFDKILHNLLSNAFKYTHRAGTISLSAKENIDGNNSTIEVSVSDNGKGIPEKDLPHIFDRFYQLNAETDNEIGTGIGLALTKNLVSLHYGDIKVESKENIGTIFTFTIPISKDTYNEENIVENEEVIAKKREIVEVDEEEIILNDIALETEIDQGYKVLIIEDNNDLREVLRQSLADKFNVQTAHNGFEGLEKAKAEDFNIIISDIMMPGMNGIELCKTIKKTFETSHIPVILLTARVAENNRIEGYKAGADSYITKPVNLKILKTRIIALIKQYEQLRKKFRVNLTFEPEKIKVTSVDENFIADAKNIVEENMGNPDFNVKILYSKLGVSNSVLYRKLTAFTGLTPNEFIKTMRLKRAAQLIKQNAMSITDVAYETGFNDPSYFGVCFKKEFGQSPLQYSRDELN